MEIPLVQKYLPALPAPVPLAQVTGGDPSCTEISPGTAGSCTSGPGYWWRPLVYRNISRYCRLLYLWPRLLVETPRVQKYLPALPAPVPLAQVTGGDPSCTEISPGTAGSYTSGSGYWWRPLVYRNISRHCRLLYLWLDFNQWHLHHLHCVHCLVNSLRQM